MLFVFEIETDRREALAAFDLTPHLSTLGKVTFVIRDDDVRVERVAASFAVPVLIVETVRRQDVFP